MEPNRIFQVGSVLPSWTTLGLTAQAWSKPKIELVSVNSGDGGVTVIHPHRSEVSGVIQGD
ncbi:hypothetical protein CRG98_010697 [Punica granatum]|uniref:Uncharacterized protein n=1 Tax=Punica granatum TaxID=22663 RepID=A0A2I0KK66_PUNGR|nr:hypothetical protein CRG98_010697 [Punica granatum]